MVISRERYVHTSEFEGLFFRSEEFAILREREGTKGREGRGVFVRGCV